MWGDDREGGDGGVWGERVEGGVEVAVEGGVGVAVGVEKRTNVEWEWECGMGGRGG